MIPGPTQIHACPECGDPFAMPTLMSGNTFGATHWTDGKVDAPMLPRNPPLSRCSGCRAFFWVHDTPLLGELGGGFILPLGEERAEEPLPPSWEAAPHIRHLDEAELLEALARGLSRTREEELELRILAWWAGNDAARPTSPDEDSPPPKRSPEAEANLVRLYALLDPEDVDERLLKIEAARHLGRFTEAASLLELPIPPARGVDEIFLQRLVEAEDRRVHVWPF